MSALKDIMSPKSVAIVGASDDKGRIGGKPLSYMLDQNYSGKIFPVNPKHQTIQGLKSYKSLTEIEDDLDFVLVAVPSIHVTNVLNEAVKKKAKTALIFSSGFAEMGGIGKEYQDEIENISKETSLVLDINYLTCEKICIPANAFLQMKIPPGTGNYTKYNYTIQKALSFVPRKISENSNKSINFSTKTFKNKHLKRLHLLLSLHFLDRLDLCPQW